MIQETQSFGARLKGERDPATLSSMNNWARWLDNNGRRDEGLELIQRALGISHPFMCENGAALVIPRGYFSFGVTDAVEVAGREVVEFGRPYADVVAALQRTASRLTLNEAVRSGKCSRTSSLRCAKRIGSGVGS